VKDVFNERTITYEEILQAVRHGQAMRDKELAEKMLRLVKRIGRLFRRQDKPIHARARA